MLFGNGGIVFFLFRLCRCFDSGAGDATATAPALFSGAITLVAALCSAVSALRDGGGAGNEEAPLLRWLVSVLHEPLDQAALLSTSPLSGAMQLQRWHAAAATAGKAAPYASQVSSN